MAFSLLTGSVVYKLLLDTSDQSDGKTSATKSQTTGTKDDSAIHYVTGQRGARKIVCGGFSYICAKINGDRKYWVCAKQRSRNCKARLITNSTETIFIRRNQSHNHNSENSTSRTRND